MKAWHIEGKPTLDGERALVGKPSLRRAGTLARTWQPALRDGAVRLFFFDPADESDRRCSFEIVAAKKPTPTPGFAIDRHGYSCSNVKQAFGPLKASAGWHMLCFEIDAGRLRIYVDDFCLGQTTLPVEESLRGIRIVHGAGKLWIDELSVTRKLQPLATPMPAEQDSRWLEQGEQIFGRIVTADRDTATLEAKFGKRSLPWSRLRGNPICTAEGAARREGAGDYISARSRFSSGFVAGEAGTLGKRETDRRSRSPWRNRHRPRSPGDGPFRGEIIASAGEPLRNVSTSRRITMTRHQAGVLGIALVVSAGLLLSLEPAADSAQAKNGPDAKDVQKVVDKAVDFLKSSQQKDGAFSPKIAGPGVTALTVAALLRNGVSPQEPVVAKGLEYLAGQTKEDGGIYSKFLANYTTAVALMAFKEANQKGKYDQVIKKAGDFMKKIQHDEEEADLNHGGFGYDKKSRPDLSNTSFTVEALLAAGLSRDDPAVQKALKFISRCQNLPGEKQDQPFAKKTSEDDKGGFTYDPHMSDKNANKTADGGLRSLGAMTYNGLKSFLYAGVSKDDPRVKAAVVWVRHHYTLEENPGMGKAGLYYYYHTFAKAMDVLGEDPFVDAKGVKHAWRMELFQALQKRQAENGSWRNNGEKTFAEDNPDLATAFALLSLSYCKAGKR